MAATGKSACVLIVDVVVVFHSLSRELAFGFTVSVGEPRGVLAEVARACSLLPGVGVT